MLRAEQKHTIYVFRGLGVLGLGFGVGSLFGRLFQDGFSVRSYEPR